MIRFLIKGILRDRTRSLLPALVIALGVMLTVVLHCWMNGVLGESIEMNARFNTGHVKVMTRAYALEEEQMPNELALFGADSLLTSLRSAYPGLDWVKRIRFGGLIDFPGPDGETRAQGPVAGWAIDLLNPASEEAQRFNIRSSLVSGDLPDQPGEALITSDLASGYHVHTGDRFTLFGSTMQGGMAFRNFTVSGLVRFGSSALDRGAVIISLEDAGEAFQMEDAAGEILGFFTSGRYDHERALQMKSSFNDSHASDTGDYAPVMLCLKDQGGMAEYLDLTDSIGGIMVAAFILAMSVVLWNIGLLGGLRRYNEFGVRLALGESKKHIYMSLIYEALIIGLIGSVLGTGAGLGISWYLQEVGFNMEHLMQNSTLMMPSVVRAAITPAAFYIGFIPGLISVAAGAALSGIGIYKRQTAGLFKELEV